MDVFDLFAKLSLDSSEYEQGLDDAEKKGSGFGAGLQTAAKVGAAAVAAVGTAAIGAGAAIVKGAGDVAEYGDNIDKMSQKMGISAEAYQEWDAIMQHSGTSMDSMSRGMQTLQKNAVDSADKFEALGLSQEQVASMSTEDLFAATIRGLQNMGEGAERTALASELLGGSAKELGALLNTSAEDTEAMRERVHELGGVMSDDAVKAAAAYQDQLQDMQTAFAGLKRGLTADFMPALTTVMGGLTNLFSGNYDEGIQQISDGLTQVINNISAAMPQIIETGGQLIQVLGEAIISNIVNLAPVFTQLVTDAAQMLIDNLPMILDSAMQLVLEIANGIGQALPELLPAVVDVIISISESLLDNIDMLIDTAVVLVEGIATGLVNAIPKLIEKAPIIIGKLVEALLKLAPKLLQTGVSLIGSLITGIGNSVAAAVKGILDLGNAIINKFKELFGFSGSSSSKFLDFGKSLITGLVNGIKNTLTSVGNVIRTLGSTISDGISTVVSAAGKWASDLIDNFVRGITNGISKVGDAVKKIAEKIKGLIGFSEPDEGPLSNFHTYAPDMVKLFTEGIKKSEGMLEDQIKDSFDIGDIVMDSASVNVRDIGTTSGAGAFNAGGITINLYARDGQTARDIVDEVEYRIAKNVEAKKAVWGMS